MSKGYKLITLQQLAKFCEEQNLYNFNAKETGYKIAVRVPGIFESRSEEDSTKGLLFVKLKVCHTELNRNGSYISEENMKKAMPSLKYRPVLGYIHQLDDGEYDFHRHDINIIETEDDDIEYEYLEHQIGAFTVDEPYLEYDKEMDKTYVIAHAAIPEEYTKAADIIRRKNGSKVSCELCVESFSYNAKEKYLNIEDFYFTGVTCLGSEADGTEIGEGMLGSKITELYDYGIGYMEKIPQYNLSQKLIDQLEKLNTTLSNFNIDTIQKGGKLVSKFEELLNKFGKTAEDIEFDYESMTDEELEAKFEELFGEESTVEGADPEPTSEEYTEEVAEVSEEVEVVEEIEETTVEVTEEVSDEETEETEVVVENELVIPNQYTIGYSNGTTKVFELSLSDIQSALYNLVNDTYSEADNAWYSVDVYDSHVVMRDWWNNKAYKQTYKREEDNFSLTGDRVEVFANWLTKEEEAALAELRSNYTVIESKLNDYIIKEENEKKDSLFVSSDYSSISQFVEFSALKENHDNLTYEELVEKLDAIVLSYAKSGSLAFSNNPVFEEKTRSIKLPINAPKKKSRYGTLFSKN